MTRYVFEEHPLGVAFTDDPGDIWPEVAGIIGPTTLASGAEWLAGVSGEHDVEGATERAGIEAAKIVPDRGWHEIPGALCGDEDRSRPVLPLDKGAGVIAGFGEHEAQIKASAACAEGQSVPGT